jgi:hypothetical protein
VIDNALCTAVLLGTALLLGGAIGYQLRRPKVFEVRLSALVAEPEATTKQHEPASKPRHSTPAKGTKTRAAARERKTYDRSKTSLH